MVSQYIWNDATNVSKDTFVPIVPLLHGTQKKIAQKIANTGFAALSLYDQGYYGKGVITNKLNL